MKKLLLLVTVFVSSVSFGQTWVSGTPAPQPNGVVKAIETHDNNLIVAGKFTEIGGIVAFKVAKWDGNSWSTVGLRFDGSNGFGNQSFVVTDLCSNNGELYAICDNSLYYLADLDTCFSWSYTGIDTKPESTIYPYGNDIIVTQQGNGDVYIGNKFSYTIHSSGLHAKCFQEYNGTLYAGSSQGLFKWNGSAWNNINGVTSGDVDISILDVWDNKLLLAGYFSSIGGLSINNKIAFFDGNNYSQIENWENGLSIVSGVKNLEGELWIAGYYNGQGMFGKYDGTNVIPVYGMTSINSDQRAELHIYESEIYAGGHFNYNPDIFTQPTVLYMLMKLQEEVNNVESQSLTMESFSVYPNPTSNSFTISSERVINSGYKLMDAQGRVVLTGIVESCEETVDISSLPTGIYSVVFEQQDLPVLSIVKE